jgi:undecaprenyl-diphosphatase
VTAFDAAIREFVHRWASPGMTEAMRVASGFGAPLYLAILAAAVVAVLLAERARRDAIFFLVTMAGVLVLDSALKLLFHRERPPAFFGIAEPNSYSFPSGHALVSTCFLGAVAILAASRFRTRAARVAIWCAAIAAAALIGLSRIYLGVHYPSDVLGGYAIAALWLFAATRLFPKRS